MNTRMKTSLSALLLFLLAGCEIPDKGAIDTAPPPLIVQATATPGTLDVNLLANQPTDPVDTTIAFTASVSNLDAGTSVTYMVFDPVGNLLIDGPFLDDGVYPDQIAGDGKLSAAAHLHILKRDVGTYAAQIQARSSQGFISNTILLSIAIKNSNNHPPHISNLTMPDSIKVPAAGDTTFVTITLAVSDSEGLGDIVSVKLTSKKPDGSSSGQFNLYDDGGTIFNTQFGVPMSSGDLTAGDGIYTIRIPFTGTPEPPPTYRDFSFVATDRTGDHSNTLTLRIYIVQ